LVARLSHALATREPRCGAISAPVGGQYNNQEMEMKCALALFAACTMAVLGTGVAPAASPQVAAAIKAVEAVGNDPAKLKVFCEFNKLLQSIGDTENEASQKQIGELVAKIGQDFSAAWDVAEEIDENSEDGQEFYDAIDTLAEKCQ
jgi:hypothetical protein